jgi:hypothetical protein
MESPTIFFKLNATKRRSLLETTLQYPKPPTTINRPFINNPPISNNIIKQHVVVPTLNKTTNITTNILIYILSCRQEDYEFSLRTYSKYPWAKPILMKYQDYSFENAFWKELGEIEEEWINKDMVGTLAYSAIKKIDINKVNDIIMNQTYLPNTFYHFMDTNIPIPNDRTMLHPQFMNIWNDVLKQLNLKTTTEANCNYWMCTPTRMKEFLTWYETKCKPVLLAHPNIFNDAKHKSTNTKNDKELVRLWGKPYYPHYPFIMERLVKSYFLTLDQHITSEKEHEQIISQDDLYKDNSSINQNILILIACHTNSELKKKALIHNVKILSKISKNIVIINSTDQQDTLLENSLKEAEPSIVIQYSQNDKYYCYSKWLYGLSNNNYSSYDNVMLTNDSFILTREIDDYANLITKDTELVAICDAYEIKHHYPDFIRTYNQEGLRKVIQFYNSNKNNITNFLSCVYEYEVKSSSIFNKNNIRVLYPNNSKHIENIHFIDEYTKDYLYNKNYPCIKIKKLEFNYYESKVIPSDFNPSEYRKLNIDLSGLNDTVITNHFKNHGLIEGRLYKENQKHTFPPYLSEFIKNRLNILEKYAN